MMTALLYYRNIQVPGKNNPVEKKEKKKVKGGKMEGQGGTVNEEEKGEKQGEKEKGL